MNPYSFLDPVTDFNLFYGYRDKLEEIVERVSAIGGQRRSFFVAGSWRMGKTSLLLQTKQRLELGGPERKVNGYQQVLIPIYIDFMTLGERTRQGVFGSLGYLLARYLKSTSFSFSIPPQLISNMENVVTAIDPYHAFEDALDELIKAVNPWKLRVVFLIDEFGRVSQSKEGETVALNLRALYISFSAKHILAYVIAGGYRDLLKMMQARGSPLPTIMEIKKLHVFNEEQSLQLIQEPTEGQIPIEVAKQVYQESGGHPYLIQYLMSVLCEQGNLHELKTADILRAVESFAKRKDFEHWWQKMEEFDRKIYEVFYRNRKVTRGELNSMMLSVPSSTLEGRQVVADGLTIDNSLRVLETTGLIRELAPDTWELAGEMFASWYSRVT